MVINASNGKVPSADNFCQRLMQLYKDESAMAANKQNLIVAVMDVHLARLSGNTRAGFPTKVLNFFMAIYCLSPKASEMVTANLQGVSKHHIQHVSAKRCGPPVIHLMDKEIVLAVEKQIKMVHGRSGNKSLRIAMSLGVDATVILQAFQYLASHNAVIGGAYSNHWLEVGSMDKDDIQAVLKLCLHGEFGDAAAEVKVAVLSFQFTLPGFLPYLILVGQTQSINHSNSFASDVMSLCVQAAKNNGNAVIFNESTDGVSCKSKANTEQQKLYLAGKSDQLSFTDTCHNVKNNCLQNVGGSGATPASSGSYCFDPMLLKMAGVPKEVVRIVDFASDGLVLKLASAATVQGLLQLQTNDTGNRMVSVCLVIIYYCTI